MAQHQSKGIPRVIVCRFPHKFACLTLEQQSSASFSQSISPSFSSCSTIPCASPWQLWRRRIACGEATSEEEGEDDAYSGEESSEEDSGSCAQRDSYHQAGKNHKRKQHQHHHPSDGRHHHKDVPSDDDSHGEEHPELAHQTKQRTKSSHGF